MSSNNSSIVSQLHPQSVFSYFAQLSDIPRPSLHEQRVREWLKSLCEKHSQSYGWEYHEDQVGNVVIRVPANDESLREAPVVVFQGHIDMVCEANSDVQHDFMKDPIELKVDGDWLKANGTTLGSDNGIGVCIALALASDSDTKHGPLELLFTVDEEEGMTGAMGLKQSPSDFVTGRQLINLDSEEDGIFFIGSAGALEAVGQLHDLKREAAPQGAEAYKLHVLNLNGGHSGIDIHKGLANANKILARVLHQVEGPLRLAYVDGGKKRNAIPREAFAVLHLTEQQRTSLEKQVEEIANGHETRSIEPNLTINLEKVGDSGEYKKLSPFSEADSNKIVRLMHAIPHGPVRMSVDIDDFVETSTNFGVVKTEGDNVVFSTMQRSSHQQALNDIAATVKMTLELAGCTCQVENPLSPWQPNPQSKLLHTAKEPFKSVRGQDAQVMAIHAGLECGLLRDAFPDMECLSYGPTIKGAHSPSEKCKISDVNTCYLLTKEIMKKLYSK